MYVCAYVCMYQRYASVFRYRFRYGVVILSRDKITTVVILSRYNYSITLHRCNQILGVHCISFDLRK